jgi:hypothetical protein
MTTYAKTCVLALLHAIDPNATADVQSFRYEPHPDATPEEVVEVVDFHDQPETEVAAWRHVPGIGWGYALRPFDITTERDQYRVTAGDVTWSPLTEEDATPPPAAFVELALAAIAEHPIAPAVQP